jgi:hypothetical protein
MSESNSTQSAPQALPRSELVMQATKPCDELEDLMALHYFFYQAVEHFFNDQGQSFRRWLSLFTSWLRERDLDALDAINELQEGLRVID